MVHSYIFLESKNKKNRHFVCFFRWYFGVCGVWQTIIDNLFKRRILSLTKRITGFRCSFNCSVLCRFISIWIQYRISSSNVWDFFFSFSLDLFCWWISDGKCWNSVWTVNFKYDCVSDIFWVYLIQLAQNIWIFSVVFFYVLKSVKCF